MGFRLENKEIRIEQGYATIRELSPMDNMMIAKVVKDKEDEVFLQNAIIAMSVVSITAPDYSKHPNVEDYMVLDKDNSDNYINDEVTGEKILNPELEKYNHDESYRYILDKEKGIKTTYPLVIKSEEDILKRIADMGYKNWTIVASHSLRMNEPNPAFLGK